MALRTTSKLHHQRGVVAPRTTSNRQQQRATAGVVAPRTTSNLHQRQRAPAGSDAHDEPPKTSWCMVERATASYDYVVTEYSKLDMVGVGQYVSSDAFRAGGHHWKIRLYPKQAQGIADYYLRVFPVGASLHLCDADQDTQLSVRFTLSVLQRDGRVSPMASRTTTASFGAPPRVQLHGFDRLFDRTRFRPWRCVHNDAFTVRCTLSVVQFTSDPGRLLESGKGADVTFQVRGHAFPAHRFILEDRSPVLLGDVMLTKKKKAAPCIEIVGVRPEVFELLLRFIYTDALPGDGEGCDVATMQHLQVAADRYGLHRLKHICELKLHASVDA